ncbi:MAG: transferase [Chlorobium sp.]|nr:MAG: transferase [Chlorobium sp.]
MQVIVFEDTRVNELKPLVNLKPVFGLVTGFRTLQQKFEQSIGREVILSYHLRRYLAPVFAEQHPSLIVNRLQEDDVLLVNGRLVSTGEISRMVNEDSFEPGKGYMQGDNLLFARVTADALSGAEDGTMPDMIDTAVLAENLALEKVVGFRIVDNIWDLIAFHPDELLRDAENLELGRHEGEVHASAVIVNPSNVYIGPGAVVRAGAVLDAEEGFVALDAGAVADPHSLLMQNVYLGPRSRAKSGAKIYSNVSIGNGSKIGGEVEDSIIEPYVNKQHDGFLGHSYLSSWCNLGAGTNNSDLKNNYSAVRIMLTGRERMTGLQFLGLLMGEHSKCSINSMFNTGTVVGTGANIFGGGFPPKEVPSFSWGGNGGFEPYDIDKAVETARKVMERRQVFMSSAYEEMFRFVAGTDGMGRILT